MRPGHTAQVQERDSPVAQVVRRERRDAGERSATRPRLTFPPRRAGTLSAAPNRTAAQTSPADTTLWPSGGTVGNVSRPFRRPRRPRGNSTSAIGSSRGSPLTPPEAQGNSSQSGNTPAIDRRPERESQRQPGSMSRKRNGREGAANRLALSCLIVASVTTRARMVERSSHGCLGSNGPGRSRTSAHGFEVRRSIH
jgi:hypothetical protein